MKHNFLQMIAMGILLFVQPLVDETHGQSHLEGTTVGSPLEKETSATDMEVHIMMGHINLAYLALGIDLPGDASNHIDKAEGLAARLHGEVPSPEIHSTLKYGKVSFTSRGATTNYYVPVLDDLFLLSEYDTVYRHLQSIDLPQTHAGIVGLDILVDLRKLVPALKGGQQDLDNKKYQQAQAAFAEIFQGAIVDEFVITDPRRVVYDNLALAMNLIQNGLYPSARLTLKTVKNGLAQWEKDPMALPHAQGVKTLHKEILQLDAALENKDPSVMQRVGGQFLGWKNIVKSWF
ncbi:MAG: hypothetical protein KC592_14260, partial [Nitrospira sp.]|nr:hypothetical protein [Nitrospira sp.]